MRLQFFARNWIPGVLRIERDDQFHTEQCLLLTQCKVRKLSDTWYVWRDTTFAPLLCELKFMKATHREYIFVWLRVLRNNTGFEIRDIVLRTLESSFLASACMNVDKFCIFNGLYAIIFWISPHQKYVWYTIVYNVHLSTQPHPTIKSNAMLQYRLKSILIKFPSSDGYDFICYQIRMLENWMKS